MPKQETLVLAAQLVRVLARADAALPGPAFETLRQNIAGEIHRLKEFLGEAERQRERQEQLAILRNPEGWQTLPKATEALVALTNAKQGNYCPEDWKTDNTFTLLVRSVRLFWDVLAGKEDPSGEGRQAITAFLSALKEFQELHAQDPQPWAEVLVSVLEAPGGQAERIRNVQKFLREYADAPAWAQLHMAMYTGLWKVLWQLQDMDQARELINDFDPILPSIADFPKPGADGFNPYVAEQVVDVLFHRVVKGHYGFQGAGEKFHDYFDSDHPHYRCPVSGKQDCPTFRALFGLGRSQALLGGLDPKVGQVYYRAPAEAVRYGEKDSLPVYMNLLQGQRLSTPQEFHIDGTDPDQIGQRLQPVMKDVCPVRAAVFDFGSRPFSSDVFGGWTFTDQGGQYLLRIFEDSGRAKGWLAICLHGEPAGYGDPSQDALIHCQRRLQTQCFTSGNSHEGDAPIDSLGV